MKKLLVVLMALLPCVAVAQSQPQTIATYVIGHSDPNVSRVLAIDITQLLTRLDQYRAASRNDDFMIAAEEARVRGGGQIAESRVVELAREHGISRVCIVTTAPVLGSFYISAKIVNVETGATIRNGELDNSLSNISEIKSASQGLVNAMVGREVSRDIAAPAPVAQTPPPQQPAMATATPAPRPQQQPAHSQQDLREATGMVGMTQTAPVYHQPPPRPQPAQPQPPQHSQEDVRRATAPIPEPQYHEQAGGRTRAGLRFALNMALATVKVYDAYGSSWSPYEENDNIGYGFESGLLINTDISESWAFNWGANIIWTRTPVSTEYYTASEGAIAIPAAFRWKIGGFFTYYGAQLDFPISDIEDRNAASFDFIFGIGFRAGNNVEFDFRGIRSFGFVDNSFNDGAHMEQITLGITFIFGK